MAIYAGVALLAMALVIAIRLMTDDLQGARWSVVAFSMATMGVLVALPAGYAYAMAR